MAEITPTEMSPLQKQQHDINIKNFNRSLNQGRSLQQTLGKDSFLRILTEQLKNQDPLKPQDDKEFIAQMAQFNSLEQMMELNKGFTELSRRFGQGQALGLLGREVTINSGLDHEGHPILVSGLVSAIEHNPSGPAKLTVDDHKYNSDLVIKVAEATDEQTQQ
ncbi:flagellar hook capping FlgD N-terminal domain-containing protein [Candidatus Haliotispira prima]|uniref:Basal-body rod modification protein FlgD n=1 Tax=Candidatus Haliotispira prima TaxID=3034016 RepID=A0ABY8MH83_9SPIO|nr:flagellar hook capping FlgD N-terminal domain-containing protein [Candidatus Haliotispira prima]